EGRKVDFTEDFKENVKIFPAGGTTPFQKVYKDDHSVNNLIGGKFVVNHNGKKLASTIVHF
ncbi:10943_t:CDS:1, partial [Rhizophagus irregularis]